MTAPDAVPMALMIGGVPGSGKTTIGRALAVRVGAALLDLDTLTNPLMARIAGLIGAGDNLDHPGLRGDVRTARYRCLRDTITDVLAGGCSVVAVAPFTAELADPVALSAFRDGLSISPLLVQTIVDPATARSRRLRRAAARDREYATPAAPTRPSPTADLQVDGAGGVDLQVNRILARLTVRLPGA